VGEQMPELTAQDRLFAGRDHVHTAVYERVGEARFGDAPAGEYALDRPYPGVHMLALRADDGAPALIERAFGAPGDAVVVEFRMARLIVSALGDRAATGPHLLAIGFVAGDVIDRWRARVGPIAADPRVLFASPFLRTVPGTD